MKGKQTLRHQRLVRGLVLLAGLLPLLLAACGTSGNGGPPLADDQTFVYPYTRSDNVNQVVLDPHAVAYLADSTFTDMLYSGLVTFSPDLTVVGDAATDWTVDTTGKIYTFHLRQNMHFSDGTPLTATDFAYSLSRAFDPHLCDVLDKATYGPAPGGTGFCSPGLIQNFLGHIVGGADYNSGTRTQSIVGPGTDPNFGVSVLDPLTLQIRLDAPVAYFMEALTYPTSYPVEKKLVDRYPNGTWVQHLDEGGTNGPFKVAQYDASSSPQRIILEPNPYWEQAWGKNLTLKKVIRPLYASVDSEYKDYRSGKYDFTDVPVQSYFTARGQSDFNEVPFLAETYFGLNFNQPPMNNKQVRQALSLSLNKQLLVDRVENGGAIPTNHIVPKGMPGFNSGLLTPGSDPTQSLTGNQTEAQNLLKAAQATCKVDPITFQMPAECPYITSEHKAIEIHVSASNQTRVAIATFAAQQWNTILGLNIQVVPTKPDDFGAAIFSAQNPYQMWILGWAADYPDPQDWLSLQFMSNSPANYSQIKNAQLDQLFRQADSEQNQDKRMGLYNQAEQMVVEEVPWIPYEQAKLFWRMRPWVRGFGLNSQGLMVDIAWANVYIANH